MSAVQTKFAQHTTNGKSIIHDCRENMERVLKAATVYRYSASSVCLVECNFSTRYIQID